MKKTVFIISVLFLFSLAACAKGEAPSMDTGTSGNKPTPPSVVEKEDPPIENNGSGEAASPKKYDNYAEAYLDILKSNSEEIMSPMKDGSSEIVITNVFGDETPELLYIYRHDIPFPSFDGKPDTVAAFSLKIFTFDKSEGTQSVFDSVVFIVAGGPDDYCVYLTHGGDLMLYHAPCDAWFWGFWQIEPNVNLETTDEYGDVVFNSALSKLYSSWDCDDLDNATYTYKENGEEISKVQFDKKLSEIMGDMDRVLFLSGDVQNGDLRTGDLRTEDPWPDFQPLKAENMTYDEAVAWLEAQIGDQ